MNIRLGNILKSYWPLPITLVVYYYFVNRLSFTQDDAYITYRYVANFLNGDGLVFNIGERIEGFTNFGWTIFLLFWGSLGLDFIVISKLSGTLFGAGLLALTYLMAREVFGKRGGLFSAGAVLLVGFNQSLAYWGQAGLETAAFSFFAMLSLYLFIRAHWLLIFSLLITVWIRPEGVLLAGILVLTEAIIGRRLPRFTLTCGLIAFIFSIPYLCFKIIYYGSIFPNPFYAKTSFDLLQLSNGLEYVSRYFQHYGFWGVGLLVPLLFYRRLDTKSLTVWWFAICYAIYLILIGGDVIMVHRFCLPLFGPVSILIMLSLFLLLERVRTPTRQFVVALILIPLLALTYTLPGDYVRRYLSSEKALTTRMKFMAEQMRKTDSRNFSVAVSTIGMFSYELLGHEIIDLLGLTDSTIARHSEAPIPGMETTWKEQKHNSGYLLAKAPDYILFSTGIKPSAPAERALFLYRQFTDSYRTVGWYYVNPMAGGRGMISDAFKKVRPVTGTIEPVFPVQYVEDYKLGMDAQIRGEFRKSVNFFERAIAVSPEPHFIYLDYQRAFGLMELGQSEAAIGLLHDILARDSLVYEAHTELYFKALRGGDFEVAKIHQTWIQRLAPGYWPRALAIGQRILDRQPNR